ncbi:MAG: fibrobacter succinogenes major paralogous domain-containing protein, partial [Bacteroidales bacterium]|nr:fibrobacter succinogenes major paralogous domain-containing protein [Bacteroidales bacterium]
HITLTEDTYDTLISQSLLGTPNCSLLEAGVGVVSNDLDEHNPLTAGTHTITWILFDTCQTAMDSCYQTVEVVYTPCVGVEYYDHLYTAERIGFQCWMTENLRNTLNSQEETIANYHAYKENSDNIAKFGYLYSWYSAMNVTENDNSAALTYSIGDNGQPYVQGICPNGWAVGSLQDYTALLATVGDSEPLKDAGDGYWLPSFGGTLPNSGFNARGNGFYNSVSQRYEDLLTGAHFWMPESATADGVTVNNFFLQYYCPDAKFQHNPKGDRKGVRCIRKVAP